MFNTYTTLQKFLDTNFLNDPIIEIRKDGNQRVILENNRLKFGWSNYPDLKDDILHEICHIILSKDEEMQDLQFNENDTNDLEFHVIALTDQFFFLSKSKDDQISIAGDNFHLSATYGMGVDSVMKKRRQLFKKIYKTWNLEKIKSEWNKKLNIIKSNNQ